VILSATSTDDHNLELAISRWLRSYRTYRNQTNRESEESLVEAEANLLFHFSANATLPDDLLFRMFKLFVLTLKATDGTAGRLNSLISYTALQR
jgi:hypothetical protein